MGVTTYLAERNLPKFISQQQFNPKEYATWLEKNPRLLEPPQKSFTPDILTVKLIPHEKTYSISIKFDELDKNASICFVNEDQVIGRLFYQNGHCELLLMEKASSVDIDCVFEGESLSIKSQGVVYLSGDIKAKQSIRIDSAECCIRDTEVIFDDDSVQHNVSFFRTAQMIIRAAEDIVIEKDVRIDASERIYLSGKYICNRASLYSAELVLATESFINYGILNAESDITGFALEYHNYGQAKAAQTYSISTDVYLDKGKTEAENFNLQTRQAEIRGYLHTQCESLIIAEKNLVFGEEAIFDIKGSFYVECDSDIQFASKMKHCPADGVSTDRASTDEIPALSALSQMSLISRKSLDFKGYINTQKSRVIFSAQEKISIAGMISADNLADLSLHAHDIDIRDRLFQFRIVEANAKKQLKISEYLQVSENFLISAEQIEVNAILESHRGFNFEAKGSVTIGENGKLLAREQGRIICDFLHNNNGDILSQGELYCGVNYATCNRGNIAAKSISIDTAVFANLWGICADTLKVNSLISLTAGVIYSGQYNSNALLELRGGLYIVKLPTFREMLTITNLIECSKVIGKQVIPQTVQVLQFLKQIHECYQKIKFEIFPQLKSLKQQEKLASIPLYRIIAHAALIKESTLLASSTISQFSSIGKLTEKSVGELQNLEVSINKDNFQKFVQGINPIDLVEVVTPGYVSDSLVNLSFGASMSGHAAMRSIQMQHNSFDASLSSLSLKAKNLTTQGGLYGLGDITLKGRDFKSKGSAIMSRGCIDVVYDQITLHRTKLTKGSIKALKNLNIEGVIGAGLALTAHDMLLKESSFGTSEIKISEHLHAQAVIFTGAAIEANGIDLQETTTSQSAIKAKEKIHAKRLIAEDATIQARVIESEMKTELTRTVVDVDTADLKETTVRQSSIKTKDKLRANGLLADDTVIQGRVIELEAKTELNQAMIRADDKILQTGDINGKDTTLLAESISLKNAKLAGGSVKAKQSLAVEFSSTVGTSLGGSRVVLSDSTFRAHEDPPAPSSAFTSASASTSAPTAQPPQKDSTAATPKVSVDGELKANQIKASESMSAKRVTFIGMFVDGNTVDLEDCTTTQSTVNTAKDFQAKNLKSDNCQVVSGQVILNGMTEIKKTYIKSNGDFVVKGEVKSEDSAFEAKKDLTVDAKIRSTKNLSILTDGNLTTTKESDLNAESLYLKSHVFEHKGTITTSDGFSLLADRLYNRGYFDVNGGAKFNVNQMFINFGGVKGKEITVNAGAFVNLWNMQGYDRLTVNAAAAFNVGLMRSMHVNMNALVSYNLGLYLPSLPSSASALFSWDTLFNVGKTLIYNVSSTAGSALGVGLGVYRLAKSGPQKFKNIFKGLCEIGVQFNKDPYSVNLSEVIGLLGDTKELVDSAKGIVNSSIETMAGVYTCTIGAKEYSELSLSERISKFSSATTKEVKHQFVKVRNTDLPHLISKARDVDYFALKQTGMRFLRKAGTAVSDEIGPSISTSAIFSGNSGRIYTRNFSEQSIWSVNTNTGMQWAQHTHFSSAISKQNQGIIHGEDVIVRGRDFTNSGWVTANSHYDSGIKRTTNRGKIRSTTQKWRGDQFANYGITRAKQADIEVKDWYHAGGHSKIDSGLIKTKTATISGGTVDLTQTEVKIEGSTKVDKHAKIDLTESSLQTTFAEIDGKVIANKSKLKVDESARVGERSIQLVQSEMKVGGKLSLATEGVITLVGSSLHAKSTEIDGALSAIGHVSSNGDVTTVVRSEIQIDDHAKIGKGTVQLTQSEMKISGDLSLATAAQLTLAKDSLLEARHTHSEGSLEAKASKVDLESYQSTQTSKLHLEQVTFSTKSGSQIQGHLDTDQSILAIGGTAQFNQETQGRIKDTVVQADSIQMSAQLDVAGEILLSAKKRIDVSSDSTMTGAGVVKYEAPEGSLKGKFTAAGAIVDIQKLEGGIHSLVYGRNTFQYFQPTEFLATRTSDSFCFEKALTRQCQLDLKAKEIDVNAALKMDKGLRLVTTQGRINLRANIISPEDIVLESAAQTYNYGVKVNSAKMLYLKTGGDLHNRGGVFQGGKILVADIQGTVYNTALATQKQDKYGVVTHYQPAQLLGGCADEDGVGLRIHAQGKVVNDASIIQSRGHNVIFAELGYQGLARTSSRVSERHQSNGWFSGNEKEVCTTDVFGSSMVSTEGRNIIDAKGGGIRADASSFVAKDGTDLFAMSDINLLGVKTTETILENRYSCFGLSKSHKHEKHESITPTLIYDLAKTQIRSHKGNINGQGALLLGPGELYTQAKNIRFSSDLCKHVINSRERTLQLDFFGLSAIQSIASGQNPISPILHQDPTLGKLDTLYRYSHNLTELTANSWNAGVSAYNTFQVLDAARKANSLGGALLQRYGLGDSGGFNPTISITIAESAGKQRYQTLGIGGVQRGSWRIIADDEFSLEGCTVDISHDMTIQAKIFKQNGKQLGADASLQTVSITAGVTPKGGAAYVGGGYLTHESQEIDYATQSLRVGGKLAVHVDRWEMDQATTEVGSIEGHVDRLKMVSRQHTASSHGFSVHAATNGVVGGSIHSSHSAKVDQQTKITVRDPQASGATGLTVDQAFLEGALINLASRGSIQIKKLTALQIEDVEHGYRYGIFANVNDFTREKKSERLQMQEQSKLIPTASVLYGEREYRAIQMSRVRSADGHPVQIDQCGDERLLAVSSGKIVLKDNEINLQLDVPIIVPERKETSRPTLEVLKTEHVLKTEKQQADMKETVMKDDDASEITECDPKPKLATSEKFKEPNTSPTPPAAEIVTQVTDTDKGSVGQKAKKDEGGKEGLAIKSKKDERAAGSTATISNIAESNSNSKTNSTIDSYLDDYITPKNVIRFARTAIKAALSREACCEKDLKALAIPLYKIMLERKLPSVIRAEALRDLFNIEFMMWADKKLKMTGNVISGYKSYQRRSDLIEKNTGLNDPFSAAVASVADISAKAAMSARVTQFITANLPRICCAGARCGPSGWATIAIFLGVSCLMDKSWKPIEKLFDTIMLDMSSTLNKPLQVQGTYYGTPVTPQLVEQLVYQHAWLYPEAKKRIMALEARKHAEKHLAAHNNNALKGNPCSNFSSPS